MPIICPYRHVEYSQSADDVAGAGGCKIIDGVLGWPLAIKDGVCVRCQAETAAPSVTTRVIAKTLCSAFSIPIKSTASDQEVEQRFGMSRDTAIARAQEHGCGTLRRTTLRQARMVRANRAEVLSNREEAKARAAAPCIYIDTGVKLGSMCGWGHIHPCSIYGKCSYCPRSQRGVMSCVTCYDYVAGITQPAPGTWGTSSSIVVGVTTAVREDTDQYISLAALRGWKTGSSLECTIDSLVASGYEDVTVFAEPDATIPDKYVDYFAGDRWVAQSSQMGAWRNWRTALRWLCNAFPDARGVLLVQDDVIFCRGLAAYLEALDWSEKTGVISLYCSKKYSRPGASPGDLSRYTGPGWKFWGACALLFPRQRALELLASSAVETLHGNKIDNRVGIWCRAARKELMLFSPSLAQHVGEGRSTMNHGPHPKIMEDLSATNFSRLSACDFVGEEFDIASYSRERTNNVTESNVSS